jgi:hypothetical protein
MPATATTPLSSSDPLAERLRNIEAEAAASKRLSQLSVCLVVGIAAVMALLKKK